MHVGTLVLQPVSPVQVWAQLGIAILWGFMIVTSILFFLVWGVRKLRGKVPPGPATQVRVWPLLAGLSVAALVGLFIFGMRDPFEQLGAPTATSVSIMLLTIAFPVFAALGVAASVRTRGDDVNRVAWWHSSLASYTHAVVAIYLLWFGVVGLMTWS